MTTDETLNQQAVPAGDHEGDAEMMEYHHQREGWIPCRILHSDGILIRIEFYHANRKGGKGRVSVTKEHLRIADKRTESPV